MGFNKKSALFAGIFLSMALLTVFNINKTNAAEQDFSPKTTVTTITENAKPPADEDLISGRELKSKTVSEVAKIYEIAPQAYAQKLSEILGYKIKTTDSFQLLHDNYGLEPSVAKDAALSLKTGAPLETNFKSKEAKDKPTYHLVIIAIFLSILYLITAQLAKKGAITVLQHRKIWNWILLLSFLISGSLAVLLIIKENFGQAIPLPFNIVYWHAEIGIVMLVAAVFHVLSRWKLLK